MGPGAVSIPTVGSDLQELVGADVYDLGEGGLVPAGYHIEQVLGMGGMGVAFLARVEEVGDRPGRPASGTRCVLKVLLPGVVVREAAVAQLSFKKEVIALARLAEKIPPSPFVVRYLDAGLLPVRWVEREGREPRDVQLPWCAVELVDGRPLGTTLDERLRCAHGPLEPQRQVALIEGIVRGVRAVHSVGLVHRDLKPSNVLVCGQPPNELAKITDFGVARAAGVGDTFDVTVGTTGYAALEQLEGPRTKGRDSVGPWSDVFALGAIIYEILCRAPMYDAANAMGFVGKVLARNYVHLAARDDLGDAWRTPEGRALAQQWDVVLARATSPRSPGGGNFASETLPMRHRDVEELLDELEPLLDATRALAGRRSRAPTGASVARVRETSWKRWEWNVTDPAPTALVAAAVRPDGVALAATRKTLLYHGGDQWTEVPGRAVRGRDDEVVGLLSGGGGTFVIVRAGGEAEVLPGGGGGFTVRLPFAVKSATALCGHPLATAWLVVHAAHGDWVVLQLRGRVAMQVARFGSQTPIDAIARGHLGVDEVLIVGGRTMDRRGPEAFLGAIDRAGRVAALPPIPGPSVSSVAVDADGHVLAAGPGGAGILDLSHARLDVDDTGSIAPARSIDCLVALPDGQVWGFAPGCALRRVQQTWRAVHSEPKLDDVGVLAAAASGARVWSIHADGRIVVGKLSIGES